MTAQFQVVNPVAQIGVDEDDECQRNKQRNRPFCRDSERFFDDKHHQQPPCAEQCGTQCRMVEKLREIGACVSEETARNHHLLLEKQRCVEEQVEFLHAIEQVVFVGDEHDANNGYRHHWQQPR